MNVSEPASTATEPEFRQEVLCKVAGQFWLVSLHVNGRRVSSEAALKHALRTGQPIGIFKSLAEFAASRPQEEPPQRQVIRGDYFSPDDSGGLSSTMGADAAVRR